MQSLIPVGIIGATRFYATLVDVLSKQEQIMIRPPLVIINDVWKVSLATGLLPSRLSSCPSIS